jgi:tetratricopeptide (TPR) repeat protein
MAIDRGKIAAEAKRLEGEGRIDEAIEEYQKLSDDNPNDRWMKNKIGDLYLMTGRIREAVAAWIGVALVYEAEGFLPQGNAMRLKAIRSAPTEIGAWRGLIENHCLMGDLRSAISAHLTLAGHLRKEGRIQEANEEWEAAFKLVPLIPPDS